MANLKISQKKEGTTLQEFLKKSSNLILLVTIMLLCILPIYFFMLIDLTSENSNIVLIIMTTSLMISIASLALQVITTFKSKGEKKKERFDAEYVQHFFQSVGAYLDGHDNMRASSYKAMAADIYRHIPSKHWNLVDKIDQAILDGDHKEAWKNLKLFSQSLAGDGIEPIRTSQLFEDARVGAETDVAVEIS